MKTAELEGAALDAAVAMAIGLTAESAIHFGLGCPDFMTAFRPSRAWSHGGEIIDREKIAVYPGAPGSDAWFADMPGVWPLFKYKGCTPLIAAMRAYVASKLGDEVELP